MNSQTTKHNQSQRGQSLVEVALFFPIFVILLAGLVEVSQLLITQNRVSSATRAGTRFAANGGEDQGVVTVVMNNITQTLQTDQNVWDIWVIHAEVNENGNAFADWEFTQVYGISNTVRAPSVDESAIQARVLDEIRRDEFDNPSDQNAAGLKIVGTFSIHDVDSILGLDAMSQLAGFSSLEALSIMRISAETRAATNGCDTFPIAVHEGARSVTPPGNGSNPYPNAGDFTYPGNPPQYEIFSNVPNVPLADAKEGYLYKVQNGFGNGNFGWLVWNEGINASSETLADSLTWWGDSQNYNICTGGGGGCAPGPGVPGSGFPGNVRGYIEPGDPTDQALHVDDWIAASSGGINSNAVRTVIQSHIETNGRTLRLVVWDNADGQGANGRYQVSGFAIFKLIGYQLDQSGGSWILAEFIRWDKSCGQVN